MDLRYSIDFKKTERSDTTNPQSEIRNRYHSITPPQFRNKSQNTNPKQ
ncbi:hypothetical protein D1AOALGA4SA_8509 [Olavius algarvensis Delta 1 endosymbiont]|nr:hypothetical protein D1AOALGA4SA_8509 [Olavius algarvensis Delta 1 endosymbiont]